MKEYKTLTREKVNVDPTVVRYFSGETPPDAGLERQDARPHSKRAHPQRLQEGRGQVDAAGDLCSAEGLRNDRPDGLPFLNDPPAIVARAFRELYPKAEYIAQLVPDLRDETGATVYGETLFPDDGSTPVISISAEAPISAAPELLAHELAHVVAGKDAGHGPEWEAVEEAIFQKYNEILTAMIPDTPAEVSVTPHKVGDGGIVAMISRANVPEPHGDDWRLTTCPDCGAECWETGLTRQALAAEPALRAACTLCALKGGARHE